MISALAQTGTTLVANTEVLQSVLCPNCNISLLVRAAPGKSTHYVHPSGKACGTVEDPQVRAKAESLQRNNLARRDAAAAGQLTLFESPIHWDL